MNSDYVSLDGHLDFVDRLVGRSGIEIILKMDLDDQIVDHKITFSGVCPGFVRDFLRAQLSRLIDRADMLKLTLNVDDVSLVYDVVGSLRRGPDLYDLRVNLLQDWVSSCDFLIDGRAFDAGCPVC